jgi:superfamily II RNA helicase
MPTKTVVFTGFKKFDDASNGLRMLNTDEYIQMAGRAGRRGKDTKGLVLYLPDREPESVEEVKRMCTGARSTFQSRMTFHYDFLLKTIHSGNLDWLRLMKDSYWYKRHEGTVASTKQELLRLDASLGKLGLTDPELADLQVYEDLSSTLKTTVNAAKKKAQQAYDQWMNKHVGPRWNTLLKDVWPKAKQLTAQRKEVAAYLAELETPQKDVYDSLASLQEFGFLDADWKPTSLGIMATEINEAHQILVPLAYTAGLFKGLSGQEVLALLATFLEGSSDPKSPDSLAVPDSIKKGLWDIDDIARRLQRTEKNPPPKRGFWDLQTSWIEPIWRWLDGATVQELCTDYEIYEGNLTRALLKMSNILEEIRTLATLAKDLELLESLRGLETHLLRDVLVNDSLYLRI